MDKYKPLTMPFHSETSAGYLRNIAYPDHFHRELMPTWLTSSLHAIGQRPPDISRPYIYMDLGCGTGLSTIVAASCNPLGYFIGVDFNAEQIKAAQALAMSLGLSNIEFRLDDFMRLAQRACAGLPQCDFIVLHGVYSWVAEPIQRAVRQLVSDYLRPGGVFYVSYISHPGAASFSAAQRFFRQSAQRHCAGSVVEQVSVGIADLKELAQGGAGYFVEHGSALREVEQLTQMSSAYLAHEFLNQYWQPMHSGEVIAQMRKIDCSYVASANLLENVDAFSLPAQLATSFARWQRQAWSVEQLETARDLARNQNQRRDIYQKHAVDYVLSPEHHRQILLDQRVTLGLAAPSKNILLKTKKNQVLQLPTRIGNISIQAEAILPLLLCLLEGEHTYEQLSQLTPYKENPGIINQLLQAMLHMSYVHLLKPDTQPIETGRLAQLSETLRQAYQSQTLLQPYLPAEKAGTVIAVPPSLALSTAEYQRRCAPLGIA